DFFQSRRPRLPFQLMLENIELVAEMIYGDDIPVHVVLHKGDIPIRIAGTLQLDVFEMRNGIKGEKPEKPVGDETEVRIRPLLKCIPELGHLRPEINLGRRLAHSLLRRVLYFQKLIVQFDTRNGLTT